MFTLGHAKRLVHNEGEQRSLKKQIAMIIILDSACLTLLNCLSSSQGKELNDCDQSEAFLPPFGSFVIQIAKDLR